MKVGPCSRLFTLVYLVNTFQNLHSGSLPLLRQIFEHVSQTEATDRYSVMIPKHYVQMKHKQIKQLPASCSHFQTLCLHHVYHALWVLRPSAFDLVLINMAGGDDPGKYKLKQCTLHNDTNASD